LLYHVRNGESGAEVRSFVIHRCTPHGHACSRLSGDWVRIPLVEVPAGLRRTDDNLFEQRKFFAHECGCSYFGVRSRCNSGYSGRMRFSCDCLTRWPCHPIGEVISETKCRQSLWSARIENIGHRNVKSDEFWAGFWQQIKKLDSPSGMLCARIRRCDLDSRIQVETTKFPLWIPAAAMLLRVRRVCWIGPLWSDYPIVEATTENCTICGHSRTAVAKQSAEIRVNRIHAVRAQCLKNGAVT
jgi:hypothetical protein